MEWKSAKKNADGAIILPERWLSMHYYEALNILFRAENSLRVFVYLVLKNRYGVKWSECSLQISENEQGTIGNVAQRRIVQAQGFGYLGYEINSPLMFLNSGELTRLMFSEAYWPVFKNYFKGKKEIIQNKLEEIASIRNSLAHFRPISRDDVEVIKQNIRHSFVGIEHCLNQMFEANSQVPTNTDANWYKAFKVLQAPPLNITLYQSQSAEWTKINIILVCKVIEHNTYSPNYISCKVLKFFTDAIVKECKIICEHCTFCEESLVSGRKNDDEPPSYFYHINIVFRTKTLINNHVEICGDFKKLAEVIENEREQLKADHFAKGIFLGVTNSSATCEKRGESFYWSVATESLENPARSDDPPEYWGSLSHYSNDFVAGARRYPWMPVDVSEFESPF